MLGSGVTKAAAAMGKCTRKTTARPRLAPKTGRLASKTRLGISNNDMRRVYKVVGNLVEGAINQMPKSKRATTGKAKNFS